MKQLLLAVLGRETRPRLVPDADVKWTQAWARRWWLVEAESADAARELIAWADAGSNDVERERVTGRCRLELPHGRVLDCGRHAGGAPDPVGRPSRASSQRRAPSHERRKAEVTP